MNSIDLRFSAYRYVEVQIYVRWLSVSLYYIIYNSKASAMN